MRLQHATTVSQHQISVTPQVDLRKRKLLWLEADRLKAVARRSAEMVIKNAEEHDMRAREAARQKGPHRWLAPAGRCCALLPWGGLQQRTQRSTPEPACTSWHRHHLLSVSLVVKLYAGHTAGSRLVRAWAADTAVCYVESAP